MILRHFSDVYTKKLNCAIRHLVKPHHQRSHRRLSAACTSDNRGCLAPAAGKVQVFQGIRIRIRKAERDIPERQDIPAVKLLRNAYAGSVRNGGGEIQDLFNAAAALQGSRQRKDHHLRHHQIEQGEHCILNNCRNITDLKMSGRNAEPAEGVDQDHEHIDCKEGNAVQNGKPLIDPNGSSGIILKLIVETLFLVRFLIKCTNHTHTRDVLQEHLAHLIQFLLKGPKHGGSTAHDEPRHNGNHEQNSRQNHAHDQILLKSQYQ